VTIGRTTAGAATGVAIAADEGSTRGVTMGVMAYATGFSGDVTIAATTGEGTTTTKVEMTGADSIVLRWFEVVTVAWFVLLCDSGEMTGAVGA